MFVLSWLPLAWGMSFITSHCYIDIVETQHDIDQTLLLQVVLGDEQMSKYFTGNNPLIHIDSDHGLQELDTQLFALPPQLCFTPDASSWGNNHQIHHQSSHPHDHELKIDQSDDENYLNLYAFLTFFYKGVKKEGPKCLY